MLDRRVRKIIESKLYSYENIKRQAYEYRESVIHGSGSAPSVNVSGGQTSDPTASKAMRLVAGIDASKWLSVMDLTIAHFSQGVESQKVKAIHNYYIDKKSIYETCVAIPVDRATLYNWLEDILTYCAMLALQFGLIKLI